MLNKDIAPVRTGGLFLRVADWEIARIDAWSLLAGARFVLASIVAIKHLDDYTETGFWGFFAGFGTFEAIMGFLLISGYSICVSYARQPDGFLVRRMMRLYPVYLASIALTCVTFWLAKVPMPNFVTLVVNLLFLNQAVTTTSLVGPAWTLSLEFWLYCLAPALMLLSIRRLRWIIFGSFASYVVYTVCRTLLHAPYYSGVGYGANLVLLSFVWVAGYRLALEKGDRKIAMRDIAILFAGHILLTVAIQIGFRMKHHDIAEFFTHDALGYAMQSWTLLAVFLLFKYFVVAERGSLRKSWFLRFLGDVSYPLYLLHASVYAILAYYGLKSPIVYYLAAVVVSAAIYWTCDFYSKKRHKAIGTT